MRDLQKIFEECLAEVKALDIPVGKITKVEWSELEDAWGRCHRIRTNDSTEFTIQISSRYADENIHLSELYDTFFHEILHTCPRCWGHRKTWVKYALMIDKAYGHEVAFYKSEYDIKNHDLPILHQMVCPNCKGKFGIKDKEIWERIQHGGGAYCGWCGNEMEIEF